MRAGRLIRITSTYFCCGVVVDGNWVVVEAAPIIKWMVGRHLKELKTFLQRRNAFIQWEVVKSGDSTNRRSVEKD